MRSDGKTDSRTMEFLSHSKIRKNKSPATLFTAKANYSNRFYFNFIESILDDVFVYKAEACTYFFPHLKSLLLKSMLFWWIWLGDVLMVVSRADYT